MADCGAVPSRELRMLESMNFLPRWWRRFRGERAPNTAENETRATPVDPEPVFIAPQEESSLERFVVMRQALLDRTMAVVGYEFAHAGELVSAEDELERDRALLRHVRGEDARKLVGGRIAFVSISCKLLFDRVIDDLSPTQTILLIRPAFSHQINALQGWVIDRISALKRAGVAVGLADGRAALESDALAEAISVAFFSVGELLPPDLLQASRQLSKQHPALKLGIRGLETQEEFDACCRLNFAFFNGPFIRRHEEWSQTRANPSALRICDLLGRMRKGAELEQIAEQIRLDPMISYRILRVANSAAVGATRNITSIADATLIVGREPLYRWLVLLLCVTAPASPGHQALLENALARGRLMELLAGPDSTVSLRQALFLTGMFSLLDAMLKVPMASLLSQMTLPSEVGDAISKRTGPCALALQLAEACEQCDEPLVQKLCVELHIELGTFNQTQAAAGAWARESAQGIQG